MYNSNKIYSKKLVILKCDVNCFCKNVKIQRERKSLFIKFVTGNKKANVYTVKTTVMILNNPLNMTHI